MAGSADAGVIAEGDLRRLTDDDRHAHRWRSAHQPVDRLRLHVIRPRWQIQAEPAIVAGGRRGDLVARIVHDHQGRAGNGPVAAARLAADRSPPGTSAPPWRRLPVGPSRPWATRPPPGVQAMIAAMRTARTAARVGCVNRIRTGRCTQRSGSRAVLREWLAAGCSRPYSSPRKTRTSRPPVNIPSVTKIVTCARHDDAARLRQLAVAPTRGARAAWTNLQQDRLREGAARREALLEPEPALTGDLVDVEPPVPRVEREVHDRREPPTSTPGTPSVLCRDVADRVVGVRVDPPDVGRARPTGKPTSWPTYAQPSRPMAMLVGTASAGSLGGRVGSPTLSVLTSLPLPARHRPCRCHPAGRGSRRCRLRRPGAHRSI